MANTGAKPPPAGYDQPAAMRLASIPAQRPAYETPKQVAFAEPPTSQLPEVSTPIPAATSSCIEPPSSYMSTIWGEKIDKPYFFKAVMAAALFLALLTVAVVSIVILMTGSRSSIESTIEVFRDLSDKRKTVIYTTRETAQEAFTAQPPGPTLAPKPETPPAPTTISPRQVLKERPMVCTMGSEIINGAMFPDDGLCDYIFYDSMYKDGRNLLLNTEGFHKDLRVFLDAYNTYKTTAFGIAFAFESTAHLKANLGASGRSPLGYFWDRDIFHFGILDTPTLNLNKDEIDEALECLKEIDNHAETPRAAGHPSFIFFALVLFNYTLEDQYELIFKNRYQPDLLIAQGHYYYGDNMVKECRVLPPTVVTRPKEALDSYLHDLTTAVDSIRKLSRLFNPNKRTLWTVSVTMKGRWTTPAKNSVGFLERCAYNPSTKSFGSYTEICHDPNFEHQIIYSEEQGAVLARHSTEQRVLAFDNEEGFCKKLCRVQGEQPEQRFGISAFDVCYDDFFNTCASMNKYGNFSRLRALRKIVEFFRTSFKTDADEAACLQLVT